MKRYSLADKVVFITMKPTMTDNHFDVLAPFLGRHLRTSVTPTHTEASA